MADESLVSLWGDIYRAFWVPETMYLFGGMVALTVVLMLLRRAERNTYRDTLFLFFIGFLGQVASAVMNVLDHPRPAEVVYGLATILIAVALIRQAGFTVFRLILPGLRVRPPRILEDLVIFAAYAIYALVRIRGAGVDLSGILALSAVTTAVIAFAMQDTLGNVLGGLAIQFDNSIKVGDWIRVGDVVGRVSDIRWRSTAVETSNWETVVIPNGQLMKNSFYVIGRREGQPLMWRRWIYFAVDPGVAPGRVISTVEAGMRAADIAKAARTPAPSCLLLAFENGNMRYGLRYWLNDLSADSATDSQIRIQIYTALQRAGIRVSEPQQTVHLIEHDEEHAEQVKEREIQRRLAALKGVDLFARMTEPELRTLAVDLKYSPYAKGDVISKQGAASDCLYIIATGEAEVLLESGDGERKRLAVLGPGRFFGEMGLMTGSPRQATVIARSEVVCYQLDTETFQDTIVKRPSIADDISKIIASRQSGLDTLQQDLADDKGGAWSQREILERIRRFFNLGAPR